MFAVFLQFLSIVVLHDFNPALTPGVMEDDAVFDFAYTLMNALHG